jgi:hypothetical protein
MKRTLTAMEHNQTWRPSISMSALPPKADTKAEARRVRFGPITDSCTATKSMRFNRLRLQGGEVEIEAIRCCFLVWDFGYTPLKTSETRLFPMSPPENSYSARWSTVEICAILFGAVIMKRLFVACISAAASCSGAKLDWLLRGRKHWLRLAKNQHN